MNLQEIKRFMENGMWEKKERSRWGQWSIYLLQRIYLTGLLFWKKGHIDYATLLSFNTVMAIVPIFALIFAIGSGFGFDVYIENWARDMFSSQPQVANAIINFAHSYIVHTQTGLFIGVGLLFMLYTVTSLLYNIEKVFDSIWQVERRTFSSMITSYVGYLFLVPIAVIVVSGLNIFVYGKLDWLKEIELFKPLVYLLINRIGPLVLMSIIFGGIYVAMPNTRVQVRRVIFPAVLASIGIMILQYVYVNLQVLFTSYNAVYGSFAALPLFFIWLQLCWYIILGCAEMCYINQNVQMYEYLLDTQNMSHKRQIMISGLLFSLICRRQHQGESPFTAKELIENSGLPSRIVIDILQKLIQSGLVIESHDKYEERITYLPNGDSTNMTLGYMKKVLEAYPTNEYDNVVIAADRLLATDTKKQAFDLYDNYLEKLDEIKINDLTQPPV